MKGTTRFLTSDDIKQKLTRRLDELRVEDYLKGLPSEQFVKRSAYYFAELNYIHPFREGNGRAIREFMRQLYALNGYDVDWTAISTDELLAAMEESVFDTDHLEAALGKCLTRFETSQTQE